MKGREYLTCALALVLVLAGGVGLTQAQGPAPGSEVQPQGPVGAPVASPGASQNGVPLTQPPMRDGSTVPVDDVSAGEPTSQNGVILEQPPTRGGPTVPMDGPTGEAVGQNGVILKQLPARRQPTIPMDDIPIGGPWQEFHFTGVGVPARGCSPADPGGGSCVPSSGGNSVFAPAPPWTFVAPPEGVDLTVTDAFLIGDRFDIFDAGVPIGTTSPPVGSASCGDDPVPCLADPNASSGVFWLAPGPHAITIVPVASPFGAGAAYFRTDVHVSIPIGGPWQEFHFTGVGVPARGCSPADPGGGSCVPSSGGNSVFAPAPPWTFVAPPEGVNLTVTDAFLIGDRFDIFDAGVPIGTTSPPVGSASCGDDPVPCLTDPNVSSGVFWLAPGPHAITIVPVASPFGAGAAYFRTDVPMPIGGPWQEFSHTSVGVPARGCSPADPGGPGCTPSSGGNSVFAPAPPWTFVAPPEGVNLTVTDAFLIGDRFDIFDAGVPIGTTSPPVGSASCGSDPVPCLADPNVSSGVFWLAPGPHAITIVPVASPYGGGAAYFRVVLNSPPLLSGLPDVIVDHTTSLPVQIDLWAYASDVETPDGGLSYTVSSSPPAGAGVSIVANRWLSMDPSTDWCVSTPVTIRATDPGGLWDDDSYTLSVTWSCKG